MAGDMENAKKMALERLALTKPRDLCIEAKVQAACSSTSCGRAVRHTLTPCGHICLCSQCSWLSKICPQCRSPISGARLRLYDECAEAGLLSSLHKKDFEEGPWTMDACRLFSFFDVALDNDLVDVVCHYLTAGSSSVTSDPVDVNGTLVKEWCKQRLVVTTRLLRETYNKSSESLEQSSATLDEHERRLHGLSTIAEQLQHLYDSVQLRHLSETVDIVLQHLKVMKWCISHNFLKHLRSCYSTIGDWNEAFEKRKAAANARVWPDYSGSSALGRPLAKLLFEVVLHVSREDVELRQMVLDVGALRATDYMTTGGDYPPASTRAAVDMWFLEGRPQDFEMKIWTFLYYLFDRFGTLPESEWRHVIDNYVHQFDISRKKEQEVLVCCLLDNTSTASLDAACDKLFSDSTFQSLKLARVLLERDRPRAALSIVNSAGGSPCLFDAVTVLRVLLACGSLREGYEYQRAQCEALRSSETETRDWVAERDVLMGELCWFSIRKKQVVELLELPFNAGEERILLKCLRVQLSHEPNESNRITEASAIEIIAKDVDLQNFFLSQIARKHRGGLVFGAYEAAPPNFATTGALDQVLDTLSGCLSNKKGRIVSLIQYRHEILVGNNGGFTQQQREDIATLVELLKRGDTLGVEKCLTRQFTDYLLFLLAQDVLRFPNVKTICETSHDAGRLRYFPNDTDIATLTRLELDFLSGLPPKLMVKKVAVVVTSAIEKLGIRLQVTLPPLRFIDSKYRKAPKVSEADEKLMTTLFDAIKCMMTDYCSHSEVIICWYVCQQEAALEPHEKSYEFKVFIPKASCWLCEMICNFLEERYGIKFHRPGCSNVLYGGSEIHQAAQEDIDFIRGLLTKIYKRNLKRAGPPQVSRVNYSWARQEAEGGEALQIRFFSRSELQPGVI